MNRRWTAIALVIAAALGAAGCAAPLAGTSKGPAPPPSLPATVDGLTVMTVSELRAARDAGKATGGPYALRGYWSMPDLGFSCPATMGQPGELEMYCGIWRFGITELDEQALKITRSANQMSAGPPDGPVLVPFVAEDLLTRLMLPPVGLQLHAPVPIVVVGHFDDPRAARCQAEARQACMDRFVVDRVVVFDPASVPDPTPTAVPSPFPFDSPPPAPFTLDRCTAGDPGPPPAFSFAGWMAGDKLQGSLGVDYAGPTLYVAITRDAVPLGEWSDTSPRWRPMGRMICIGREGDTSGVSFDSVPGSTYRVFEDGSTAPPLP